jgi:hypothetical protein
MKRFPRFDRSRIRTYPLGGRENLMGLKNLIFPQGVSGCERFSDPGLEVVVERIREARREKKPVIAMLGGHVVKVGCSPLIVDLMERGWLTHVAGNGAVSIHDFELALIGESTEHVPTKIEDGSFGMAEETGRQMNRAIREGAAEGLGYGESVGRLIQSGGQRFPNRAISILAAGVRLGIPVTIHITIGADIIHQHPEADGAALGYASDQDFLIFAHSVSLMEGGGVFLNFGSAVTGPEVFLKALSMARNIGKRVAEITTANFDLLPLAMTDDSGPDRFDRAEYYYRPKKNIVVRPTSLGKSGHHVAGDHRRTIPEIHRRLIPPDQPQG